MKSFRPGRGGGDVRERGATALRLVSFAAVCLLRPLRGDDVMTTRSTGCAALHPWLHSRPVGATADLLNASSMRLNGGSTHRMQMVSRRALWRAPACARCNNDIGAVDTRQSMGIIADRSCGVVTFHAICPMRLQARDCSRRWAQRTRSVALLWFAHPRIHTRPVLGASSPSRACAAASRYARERVGAQHLTLCLSEV